MRRVVFGRGTIRSVSCLLVFFTCLYILVSKTHFTENAIRINHGLVRCVLESRNYATSNRWVFELCFKRFTTGNICFSVPLAGLLKSCGLLLLVASPMYSREEIEERRTRVSNYDLRGYKLLNPVSLPRYMFTNFSSPSLRSHVYKSTNSPLSKGSSRTCCK
jgi:hypothetical protein